MATLIVTNTNSSGAGSLADAVAQANATAEADRIVFSRAMAGKTVALSGDLLLTNDVTISGDTNKDGDADVTINVLGGRIINTAGHTAALASLNITGAGPNGPIAPGGYAVGAVLNKGTMTLQYCSVADNTTNAPAPYSGAGGYMASIVMNYISATLSIVQSSLAGNTVAGGDVVGSNSGNGWMGGWGGTVINFGTLNLDRSSFTGNTVTGGKGGDGFSYYLPFIGMRDGIGGNGGFAAGAILNTYTVSGNWGYSGNTATAGAAGHGDVADGSPGTASNGLLHITNGDGSLALVTTGTMGADTGSYNAHSNVAGLGGADTLYALGGSTIDGGAGNDIITINSLIDLSLTTRAASTVNAGMGNDKVVAMFNFGGSYDGGAGNDTIDFSLDTFNDWRLDLSSTSFSIFGATFRNFENVTGSQGADLILGNGSANVLKGSGGNDTIDGGKGADVLDGGDGTDTLSYANSKSGVSVDLLLQLVSGGDAAGDTILNFENIIGSGYADALSGNSSANTINGRAGSDSLNGAGGNDILDGGGGTDTLTGGKGADVFVLGAKAVNADVVTDFNPVNDTLQVSAAEFGAGLKTGGLAAGKFLANTTGVAEDSVDRFIYNTATGELFFDSNGNAAGGSRLIATFTGAPALSNFDFVIA